MFYANDHTITAKEMFSDDCPYNKVKVNGRPYWRKDSSLWVHDDQARSGEYDSAPEVSDPENVGSFF